MGGSIDVMDGRANWDTAVLSNPITARSSGTCNPAPEPLDDAGSDHVASGDDGVDARLRSAVFPFPYTRCLLRRNRSPPTAREPVA